jgi:hypothetical protein
MLHIFLFFKDLIGSVLEYVMVSYLMEWSEQNMFGLEKVQWHSIRVDLGIMWRFETPNNILFEICLVDLQISCYNFFYLLRKKLGHCIKGYSDDLSFFSWSFGKSLLICFLIELNWVIKSWDWDQHIFYIFAHIFPKISLYPWFQGQKQEISTVTKN